MRVGAGAEGRGALCAGADVCRVWRTGGQGGEARRWGYAGWQTLQGLFAFSCGEAPGAGKGFEMADGEGSLTASEPGPEMEGSLIADSSM